MSTVRGLHKTMNTKRQASPRVILGCLPHSLISSRNIYETPTVGWVLRMQLIMQIRFFPFLRVFNLMEERTLKKKKVDI